MRRCAELSSVKRYLRKNVVLSVSLWQTGEALYAYHRHQTSRNQKILNLSMCRAVEASARRPNMFSRARRSSYSQRELRKWSVPIPEKIQPSTIQAQATNACCWCRSQKTLLYRDLQGRRRRNRLQSFCIATSCKQENIYGPGRQEHLSRSMIGFPVVRSFRSDVDGTIQHPLSPSDRSHSFVCVMEYQSRSRSPR